MLFESTIPATLIVDREVFVLWLRSCPVFATVERWVGGAFHYFLQLDVRLGWIQDFAPTGDVVLHQMLVQWVGDP